MGAVNKAIISDNNLVNSGRNYAGTLAIMTSLFFMWGFITEMNDILIPHFKTMFTLNYTQAALVQLSFFTAYLVFSIPSGYAVEKMGYKKGIIVGLLIMAAACLMFYPAAGMRSYPLFLIALFILASGITVLQVAANPYVAILGKPKTAASRLSLAQAVNSVGHTTAPYIGALLILSAAAKTTQSAEANAVQVPYLALAAILFIIAVIFVILKLPAIEASSATTENMNVKFDEIHSSPWQYRHLVLGAVGIFIYVGAEVTIGSFLVNYFSQPFIAGLSESQAGKFVSFYWGSAMVGRFIGSAVQRKVKPSLVLSLNAVMAALLVVLSMLTTGYFAMWTIILVGFFNSIMFPTIFTLAIGGLGRHTGRASGILCSAIVGGAVIPVLQGFAADNIGIHLAFFIPAVCYLYIVYYGLRGYIPVGIKTVGANAS